MNNNTNNILSSKWDKNDLISCLDEFYELYNLRPIKDNNGGMKSAHLLSAWYIIKQLKPKYLIESGVWKGLGTWFFEKASPKTEIVSIDPFPHYREYTSPNAIYRTEDFLTTNWSKFPKEDTFLFFDDHQNFLQRLKKAQEWGFKKIITEDNYPYQQGDCYTPKKILSQKDYVIDYAGRKQWFKPVPEDYEYFINNVAVYQEMPPIFKSDVTRWGDSWNEDYPTPDALLDESFKEKYPIYYNEKLDYTWMCYLELK